MKQTVIERFMEKTSATESGCWEWIAGCFGRTGYGGFWIEGRTALAHRVAYELFVGPIPEGLELDHLCRNRKCVNPEHLEAVTRKVNLGRGIHRNRVKTHCIRGHELTPENVYLYGTQRQCKKCGPIKARIHHEKYAARSVESAG